MTKIIFHLLNIIFVFLYIYPGSLLGFLIYKDISKQPQIAPDFVVSSNHIFVFFLLSSLGLISYFKNLKKINDDLLKTHYGYCYNLIKEKDKS